jgi:hypothetical protein
MAFLEALRRKLVAPKLRREDHFFAFFVLGATFNLDSSFTCNDVIHLLAHSFTRVIKLWMAKTLFPIEFSFTS